MKDTVIIGEKVAGEAAKIRAALTEAISTNVASNFDIAELLWKCKKNRYYSDISFVDFVQTLNIKARKAQYLTRIAEVMEIVGILRAEYEPIGVTKLREICRLDPETKFADPVTKKPTPMTDWIIGLIELAPNKTVDEVAQHVRVLMGEVGENDRTWMNFHLLRAVADNIVRPALEKAKMIAGSTKTDAEGIAVPSSDAQALEQIAVEFLNDPNSATEPECG